MLVYEIIRVHNLQLCIISVKVAKAFSVALPYPDSKHKAATATVSAFRRAT